MTQQIDRVRAERGSGWKSFWDRGGWWKAVMLAVVYLGLYLGTGWLIGQLWGARINYEDIFGDWLSVFLAVALPVIVGSILLVAFAASAGWLPKPLFGRQPVRGSWWMWLAPVLVVATVLLRVFGIEWSEYSAGVVLATFAAGLFVGISEEVLTRGVAVTLLRRRGYNEWVVALLSSLIFALLHTANLLSGQPITTVLATVGFTFGFGLMMYLVLRVTGNLIWPIILHALTDPTTMLATGGIDVTGSNQNPLLAFAGLSTLVFLIFAVVALIFIRGNAGGRAAKNEVGLSTFVSPT